MRLVAELTPVSLVGGFAFGLFVHPGVPAQSVSEFVAYLRARPDQLNDATGTRTPSRRPALAKLPSSAEATKYSSARSLSKRSLREAGRKPWAKGKLARGCAGGRWQVADRQRYLERVRACGVAAPVLAACDLTFAFGCTPVPQVNEDASPWPLIDG